MCVCVLKYVLGGLYFLGKNINEEAARVLQEGLDECERWGDLDTQALLMVEGAELEVQRGKSENSMAMLQVSTDRDFCYLLFYTKL